MENNIVLNHYNSRELSLPDSAKAEEILANVILYVEKFILRPTCEDAKDETAAIVSLRYQSTLGL